MIYPSLDLPVRPEQFDHNGNIYIRTYGTLLRKPTSQDFFFLVVSTQALHGMDFPPFSCACFKNIAIFQRRTDVVTD